MHFIPSVTPPSETYDTAWWFIFQEDKLLIHTADDSVSIPLITDPAELELVPLRSQYLGTLDGKHCYAAEVSEQASITEGMAFKGLRALFYTVPEEIFRVAGRAFQLIDWDRTHQYCGRCGHPTAFSTEERAKVCPQCGLTQYPRVAPAVIVAVIKEQQILLARAPRFPKELYSVIAGFVEAGETFEECVQREVKEEVGVDVKDIHYFDSQPWPFPHSLMVGFTATYAGGEIQVDNHEILDADWFDADNLPQIPGAYSIARRLIDWFVTRTTQKNLQ